MARRFTDAIGLLNDLLNRFEAGAASPIAHPDYPAFPSVVAADAFLKQIREAESAGAVSLGWGQGPMRDQVAHVRLASAEILYRYLRRTPASRIAEDAAVRLVAGAAMHDSLKNSASQVAEVWGRGKTWHGVASSDVETLRDAFVLAQAILANKHLGVDYKTFSRRTVGHSKTLERIEGAVVRLLSGILEFPPGARPREALRAIGLERFAPPLLIAGKIDLDGADLSGISPLYLGITLQGSRSRPLPGAAGLRANDRKFRKLQPAHRRGGPRPIRNDHVCRRVPLACHPAGAADDRRIGIRTDADLSLVGHRSGRHLDLPHHRARRRPADPCPPHECRSCRAFGTSAVQKIRTRSMSTGLRYRSSGSVPGERWSQDARAGRTRSSPARVSLENARGRSWLLLWLSRSGRHLFQARQQHRPQLRAAGKPTSFLHKNAQPALACQLLEDGTKPPVTMMLVQHPVEVLR
ncbi:hypothetical protein ACVJ19_000011 [Bradyrhizobium sp. USDA 376]